VRLHDWTGFAALAAILHTVGALAFGNIPAAKIGLVVTIVLGVMTRYLSVTRPAPMPHLLR
jgi:hypothetical protein